MGRKGEAEAMCTVLFIYFQVCWECSEKIEIVTNMREKKKTNKTKKKFVQQ